MGPAVQAPQHAYAKQKEKQQKGQIHTSYHVCSRFEITPSAVLMSFQELCLLVSLEFPLEE